jgi:hypothetical protein
MDTTTIPETEVGDMVEAAKDGEESDEICEALSAATEVAEAEEVGEVLLLVILV